MQCIAFVWFDVRECTLFVGGGFCLCGKQAGRHCPVCVQDACRMRANGSLCVLSGEKQSIDCQCYRSFHFVIPFSDTMWTRCKQFVHVSVQTLRHLHVELLRLRCRVSPQHNNVNLWNIWWFYWSDNVFGAVRISLRLSHSHLTALAIYISQWHVFFTTWFFMIVIGAKLFGFTDSLITALKLLIAQ